MQKRTSRYPIPSRAESDTHELVAPLLEDEIDELEELHQLRRHAYELRERGQTTLFAHLKGDSQEIDWSPPGNEPDDFIEKAVVLLALGKGSRFGPRFLEDDYERKDRTSVYGLVSALNAIELADILRFDADEDAKATGREYTRTDLRKLIQALRSRPIELQDEQVSAASCNDSEGLSETLIERPSRDSVASAATNSVQDRQKQLDELDSLLRPRAPVLQAARTLQALLAVPGHALSRGALLCYGVLVHELYTAAPPDRTVGSARARAGGHHTAFMTSECTRAIAGFARMLDRSAEFLEILCSFYNAWTALTRNTLLPQAWIAQERHRLGLEYTNRLNQIWPESAFPLRPSNSGDDPNTRPILFGGGGGIDEASVVQFFSRVFGIVDTSLSAAAACAKQVAAEFEIYQQGQKRVIADGAKSSLDVLRSSLEDCRGKHSTHIKTYVAKPQSQLPPRELFEDVLSLAQEAREGARKVRTRLDPAQHYLESVLDRELTNAFGEHGNIWNPGELACAAAAYGAIHKERRNVDHRLETAREFLEATLAADGSFQTQLAVDLEDSGYTLTLVWSEAIRAFAHVLQLVDRTLRPSLVRRLLIRFENTAVFGRGTRNPWELSAAGEMPSIAWTHDQPRFPRWAYRWTSALAILALDRVARMLDERINARIQHHFSSRSGRDIESSKRIGSLFYPDFGLAAAGPEIEFGDKTKRESVAMLLEQMRAHTLSLPSLPGYKRNAVSAVFYGPPGTGKTTLLEALAGSAGVLFVEITPSDIARTGEQWVERRARAVFRALSFLSRAVVCFDEFEPVLKHREPIADDGPSHMIDWLTASMLPKLKLLYENASVQSVAFALQTNALGIIDPAAVRRGRFDYRVGIYPPDTLSRIGRMCMAITPYECQPERDENVQRRMLRVVVSTAGGSMTTLARRGNYSPPRIKGNQKPAPEPGTFHEYILTGCEAPHFGTPDAVFSSQCPHPADILKCAMLKDCLHEWSTVHEWDTRISTAAAIDKTKWSDIDLLVSREQLAAQSAGVVKKASVEVDEARAAVARPRRRKGT
jgi:ATPase family associated with various cellular activities (AAA)